MKTIFVKNNTGYKATIEAYSEVASEGSEGLARKKILAKTFGVFTKEATTGKVLDTGFTAIAEDEYNTLLKHNKIFAKQVSKGAFVAYDEAPADALMDAQVIDKLQTENAELKKRVQELEHLNMELSRVGKTDKPEASEKAKKEKK